MVYSFVEREGKHTVWYCHECQVGPIAIWQPTCPDCFTNINLPPTLSASSRSPSPQSNRAAAPATTGTTTSSPRQLINFQSSHVIIHGASNYVATVPITSSLSLSDSDEGPTTARMTPKTSYSESRDQDDSSVASTSLDSVFSTNSTRTSNSALYKDSGLTVEQIQTATRTFVSLVQSDPVLRPLYESARNDPKFGPRKLQKHVRATLKTYAKDLEAEHKDRLELAASQLVRSKAGHAARCVANKSNSVQQSTKDADDSSDDETEGRPVDERQFSNDLEAFQTFLTQSNAFAKLRAQTAILLSPQPATQAANINSEETVQPHPEMNTLGTRLMHVFRDTATFVAINVLRPMGCLEPPLKAGWTRIAVECHTCGERFFDDVSLDSEGEVTALTEQMQQTLSAKITVSASGEGNPPRGSSLQCPPWLYNTYCRVMTKLGWRKTILPVARDPQTDAVPPAPDGRTISEGTLHIMACIHRNWHSMSLLQKRVDHIRNDRDLLYLLKELVILRRGRIARILSCKSIQAVHFTMFKLSLGDSLEVRHHEVCCTKDCECNPPDSKLEGNDPEYKCTSDPKRWPQVLPTHLAHLLRHPWSVDSLRTEIFTKIPKRRHGKLAVNYPEEESTEGWGLYFEEGWELQDIIVVAIIAFLPSLVFLIVWPIERSDLSAASGVAAYIVGVVVLFSSLIVIRTGTT